MIFRFIRNMKKLIVWDISHKISRDLVNYAKVNYAKKNNSDINLEELTDIHQTAKSHGKKTIEY
jgi:hypothetical protein